MVTEGDVRAAKGKDYWRLRYERHHVKVVGTSNRKMHEQDIEYKQKADFIFNHVPVHLRTLDFGCGIGRYSPYFTNYLGFDFIDKAVNLAKRRNRSRAFTYDIDEAILYKPDLVFFSTVLQHMKEEGVCDVLGLFKEARVIVMYENTSKNPDKSYLWFRDSDWYLSLIDADKKECYDHVVSTLSGEGKEQREKHSLMIFKR